MNRDFDSQSAYLTKQGRIPKDMREAITNAGNSIEAVMDGKMNELQATQHFQHDPVTARTFIQNSAYEYGYGPVSKLVSERVMDVSTTDMPHRRNHTVNEFLQGEEVAAAARAEYQKEWAADPINAPIINEVVAKPTDNEIKSALAAERHSILAEAQTPHEAGLDGALKSYVNGRADAYNNIRNALAESSTVELPSLIEPEEIAVISPELAMDDRQQSLAMGL
jgi:hypothetical protein